MDLQKEIPYKLTPKIGYSRVHLIPYLMYAKGLVTRQQIIDSEIYVKHEISNLMEDARTVDYLQKVNEHTRQERNKQFNRKISAAQKKRFNVPYAREKSSYANMRNKNLILEGTLWDIFKDADKVKSQKMYKGLRKSYRHKWQDSHNAGSVFIHIYDLNRYAQWRKYTHKEALNLISSNFNTIEDTKYNS